MEWIKDLSVETYRFGIENRRFIKVFVGRKHICTLEWIEPALPNALPCWWLLLENGDIELAGNNSVDATDFVLRRFGYEKE